VDLTAIIDSVRDPWAHGLIRFAGLLFRWVVALKHLQSGLDTVTISVLDISFKVFGRDHRSYNPRL